MRLADATLDKGDSLLYEQLTELIIRVSDYLTQSYGDLQKKVRAAMGGEVLELLNDKAERLEREAEDRGLSLGMQQGLEQGMQQGMQQGASDSAEILKGLGVESGLLEKAMATLQERHAQESAAEKETTSVEEE